MANIGDGYGSECHLLRYLGRHRGKFDEVIGAQIRAQTIRWLDFPFRSSKRAPVPKWERAAWPDAEWRAVDFLPATHPVRGAWKEFWPTTGETLNWDAIGIASIGGRDEWLLVEAKAHLNELYSSCGAKEHGGRPKIRSAFEATRASLGICKASDWLSTYYQYCNRLAALDFLARHGIPARLIMIYFTGDRRPDGSPCPIDSDGWRPALAEQAAWVGLTPENPAKTRIHEVFLPVVWPTDGPP